MNTQIDAGIAKEQTYAVARQALRPNAEDQQPDSRTKQTSEQMSSLSWEVFTDQKTQVKSTDLKRGDSVYLSVISSAMAEDEVDSVSNRKRIKFRDRAIKQLQNKLAKLVGDTYSHNFFVAELSKMGVGILSSQLSLFGVDPSRISGIIAGAKREKITAVRSSIQQLASEKVLFSIVTGMRMI